VEEEVKDEIMGDAPADVKPEEIPGEDVPMENANANANE